MSYSVEINPDESLDHLAGDWKIIQLKRGHRFSTDDVAVAWVAGRVMPQARTLLDIGCGIGSVGLLTLHRMANPQTRLTGIEVQQVSYELARRTMTLNGLNDRVRLHHGDLRDPTVLDEGATFELITGSPPYKPLGTGVVSPHPQRAGARMELRGSVYDYCRAAQRWLAPNGRFCFVMAGGDQRTEDAPVAEGFQVLERLNVVFRYGDAPMIAVMVCARADEAGLAPRKESCLTVRGPDGEWTEEYFRFRADMGMPSRRTSSR